MENIEATAPESAPAPSAPTETINPPKSGGRKHGKRSGGKKFASQDSRYLAAMASAQINNLFTVENLCQDTYLRSHFDVEGFMPIAMACNFPQVACYGATYREILECLKQSPIVQVDEKNETVRCRENAKKWVFPNPPPRWIKQQLPPPLPSNVHHNTSRRRDEPVTPIVAPIDIDSSSNSSMSVGSASNVHGVIGRKPMGGQMSPSRGGGRGNGGRASGGSPRRSNRDGGNKDRERGQPKRTTPPPPPPNFASDDFPPLTAAVPTC